MPAQVHRGTVSHRAIFSSTAPANIGENYRWKEEFWTDMYTQPLIVVHSSWINIDRQLPETSTDQPQCGIIRELNLSEVVFENKRVNINSGLSLVVQLSFEEGHYIAFSEKFGVYGFGDDESEALADFRESFVDFYCDIVEMPESELGQSTLKYKKTLVSFATVELL